ncbi:MAG: hypothetical protein HUK15_07575 [Bacteroidales bacterium]|nr:hypothetical protein [Bacteroidales bacterium]
MKRISQPSAQHSVSQSNRFRTILISFAASLLLVVLCYIVIDKLRTQADERK